jgi:hypothetical protein
VPAAIRAITLAFLALLATLLLPAVAGAQGNAGIDQYTETPPTADGESDGAAFGASGNGGGSGSGAEGEGGGGEPLPADTRDALESLGSDGAAAADIAEATAPSSGSGADGGERGGFEASRPTGEGSGGGSGDGIGGVVDALAGSDSEGLGVTLPLILLLSLLGVLGLVVSRSRTGDPRTPR